MPGPSSHRHAQTRWLVIGCGGQGRRRAESIAATPGHRLAAVYDCEPEIAHRLANDLGVPMIRGLQDALDRHEFDAAAIATPHTDHVESAYLCLEAGLNVLIEKPITTSSSHAFRLLDLSHRISSRLAVGFNHRFFPPIEKAIQLIASGAIGKLQTLEIAIGHAASPDFLAGWHGKRSLSGGGAFLDNGSHACDLARLLLGEPIDVSAWSIPLTPQPDAIDLETHATFHYASGACCHITASWRKIRGYLELWAVGDQGRVEVQTTPWSLIRIDQRGRIHRDRFLAARIRERLHRARHGGERSLVRELVQFSASPQPQSLPSLATGYDGLRAVQMVEAVELACRTGRKVSVAQAMVTPPPQVVSHNTPTQHRVSVGLDR